MEHDFIKLIIGLGVIMITGLAFYMLIVFVMEEFGKARKDFHELKVRIMILESRLREVMK